MESKYKDLEKITTEQVYNDVKNYIETLVNEATEKGYFNDTETPNAYTLEISRLGGLAVDFENETRKFDFEQYAPNEILMHEMKQRGINQTALAEMLDHSKSYTNEILKGKKNITANLAVRLETVFNLPAEFWLRLQMHHEIKKARNDKGNQKQKVHFSTRFRTGKGNKIERV